MRLTELLAQMEPFIQKWINESATAGGTAYAHGDYELYKISRVGDGIAQLYAPTSAGLAAALADANAGDLVTLPPVTLAGNYTLPAEVGLRGVRGQSILTGALTLSADSYLSDISQSLTGSGALIGVTGPASGTGYIYDCDIVVHSTASAAYGVRGDVGALEIWTSRIAATSATSVAAGVYGGIGAISIYGGRVSGTTYDIAGATIPGSTIYESGDFAPSLGVNTLAAAGTTTLDANTSYALVIKSKNKQVTGNWWGLWRSDLYNGTYAYGDLCFNNEDGWGPYELGTDAYFTLTTSGGTTSALLHADAATIGTPASGKDNQRAQIFQVAAGLLQQIQIGIDVSGGTPSGDMTWQIRNTTAGNIFLSGVRLEAEPGGVPVWSDRAAWNVTDYPTRHASDLANGGNAYHLTDIVTAGSAAKVSFDTKGRVTSGSALTASDIPSLSGTYVPRTLLAVQQDPTGFTDPANVVINYSPVNRTITLTGTVAAYWQGTLIPSLVSGWTSGSHAAVNGIYYLSYDGASFGWSTTPWTFDKLQIAYVNYSGSAGSTFAIRETHGLMPWQAHEEFHETIGCYRESGGTLGGYNLSSTTAAARRPTVSQCVIHDEDLMTTNSGSGAGGYTQMYLSGSAASATFVTGASDIVPLSTNNPYYNSFAASTWGQTLISANTYMSVWLIAIPATASAQSQQYRFIWIQGQSTGNLASQTALTPASLNLGTFTALASEFVFLAQVILQYIAGNWVLTSVTNISGNRFNQTSAPAGLYLSSVAVTPSITGDGTSGSPLTLTGGSAGQLTYWTSGSAISGSAGFTFSSGSGLQVPYSITLDGEAQKSFSLSRRTTANAAGVNLGISPGGATLGATDKAGGIINYISGQSTGTGTGNAHVWYTYPPAASSGSADNALTAQMSMRSSGAIGMGVTADDTYRLQVFHSLTDPATSYSALQALTSQTLTASWATKTATGITGEGRFVTGAYTLGALRGMAGQLRHQSTGIVTDGMGVSSQVIGSATPTSGSSFTKASAFYGYGPALSGGSTIGTFYGLYLSAGSAAGVSNAYGVYQAGASDLNYFGGNVQIGTTTNDGLLTLGGATARLALTDASSGSSAKSTPGTVNAWITVKIGGSTYYVPAYTSKTS